MADREHPKHPGIELNPSDAETMQLLDDALRQYESCMSLAEIPHYLEDSTVGEPIYSWDNPIGLVIAEKLHAVLE